MPQSSICFSRLRTMIAFACLLFSVQLQAAPSAELWSLWKKADNNSQQIISHQPWHTFVNKYVRQPEDADMYMMDYAAVSAADKKELSDYLKQLQGTDPRQYNRNEQFAYWINLYNALTVNLILDKYPVKSIRKIGSWLGFGPWDNTITEVAGQALTLNDIEHRILRPIWQDPRIHYAVNCASIGCPDLLPTAWTGAQVEALLEQAAQRYISQSKGVELQDNTLKLSSIYEWYSSDFGNQQQLLNHLAKYAPAEKKVQLQKFQGDIDYRYDWNLNQIPQ